MARAAGAPIAIRCGHPCRSVLAAAISVTFTAISPPAATPGLAGVAENASGPATAASSGLAARESRPTGNPLWAIPLSALPITRERPLFAPSRRPPPPVVVAAPEPLPMPPPPSPAEPEHPLLTLLGTIVGEPGGIGVFLDQATQRVIRLRIGQAHDEWMLRSVH
jgi:hypothetical protein